MLFFQKKISPFFFLSLALDLCRPLSRWASLARSLLSLFLCLFSVLDNMDTQTISTLRFRLYWLFNCLCFTRRRVAIRFPAETASSCISVAIPVDWVVLRWFVCGASGRTVGRGGERTVTWLPNFLGWVDYFILLPMVLRCARFARKSSDTILKRNS